MAVRKAKPVNEKAKPAKKNPEGGRPVGDHLSRKAYAATRGILDVDVRRAIAEGRIHLEDDGLIDPVRANKEWAENTTPDITTAPGTVTRDGKKITFAQARTQAELMKQEQSAFRLRKQQDQVVDRAKANNAVFAYFRRIRDSWIGWPARISATMAAELGVDAHRLEAALDRSINQHLKDLGDVSLDLR